MLGDPITRLMRSPAGEASALADQTPPAQLTDDELRRELTSLELVVREAPERGIEPGVMELVQRRVAALRSEFARRVPGS